MTHEQVADMTKLISEYSVLTVGMAILFVAFIIIFGVMVKQNMANIKSTQKLNQQLLDKLMEKTNEEEELDKDGLIHKHLAVNEELEERLHLLRDRVDADRVYIFMFHNGEYSINNFPFLKASCIFEWCLYTITQRMIDQKALPVSIMTNMCKSLLKDDAFSILDIDQYQEKDVMLYGWLKSKGAKAFFSHAIKDVNGSLAGFVACDYVNNMNSDISQCTIEEELTKSSLVISPLLSIKNKAAE